MKNDATSRDMFQGRVGQHCGDLRHGAQAARWRRAPGGHATIEACGERQCAWVRVWSANGSLGARPSGARVRAWGRRLRVQYTRPGHRHAGAVPYSRQRTVRGDGVSACSTSGTARSVLLWGANGSRALRQAGRTVRGRRLRVQYTRHGHS